MTLIPIILSRKYIKYSKEERENNDKILEFGKLLEICGGFIFLFIGGNLFISIIILAGLYFFLWGGILIGGLLFIIVGLKLLINSIINVKRMKKLKKIKIKQTGVIFHFLTLILMIYIFSLIVLYFSEFFLIFFNFYDFFYDYIFYYHLTFILSLCFIIVFIIIDIFLFLKEKNPSKKTNALIIFSIIITYYILIYILISYFVLFHVFPIILCNLILLYMSISIFYFEKEHLQQLKKKTEIIWKEKSKSSSENYREFREKIKELKKSF
ncbi:MAG: hypothetical protein ACTSQJ_14790 [Promethearchaeota archaeon]